LCKANPAARQHPDRIGFFALKTAGLLSETAENSVWTGEKGGRVKPVARFSSRWQDKLLIPVDFTDFTRAGPPPLRAREARRSAGKRLCSGSIGGPAAGMIF
jgi:hypothetical protein